MGQGMDRFDAMRLFTRIVELRSFTQAAHDLGYPKATVTHAIKQLEARLPVSMLYPHHRQLSRRVRVFADWGASLFAGVA